MKLIVEVTTRQDGGTPRSTFVGEATLTTAGGKVVHRVGEEHGTASPYERLSIAYALTEAAIWVDRNSELLE